jgi:hypothetical protein
MPTYNPIVIYFIRRPQPGRTDSVPDRDDCLRLERLGENNIRVIYTERSTDGPIVDTTTMTYQKLTHYLYRTFWMLTVSEDPFHSVQVMIPGYPSFTLTVEFVKTFSTIIVDLILTTCWQWPTVSRQAPPPLRDPAAHTVTGLPVTQSPAGASTGVGLEDL